MCNLADLPLGLSYLVSGGSKTRALGFGVTAKSTDECRDLDPNAIVVFNQVCFTFICPLSALLSQSDIGEYLRDEETLI